ncbi:MAG: hypothetical protein R3E98_14285 [Gemmatimonadota bacterium]|nr:hypothetical protein [Gemmatimonadota bacterium]
MAAALDVVTREAYWIAPSVLLALVVAARELHRSPPEGPARWGAALNAYTGVLIATMASGHLLAVSLLALDGTVRGQPAVLHAIGVVLLVPAVLVARNAARIRRGTSDRSATVRVNALLILALLLTGPRNLPLAIPAGLNIAYAMQTRRAVGRGIAALAASMAVLLLVGSVRFFLSGDSFEAFRGIESRP